VTVSRAPTHLASTPFCGLVVDRGSPVTDLRRSGTQVSFLIDDSYPRPAKPRRTGLASPGTRDDLGGHARTQPDLQDVFVPVRGRREGQVVSVLVEVDGVPVARASFDSSTGTLGARPFPPARRWSSPAGRNPRQLWRIERRFRPARSADRAPFDSNG